MNEWQKRVPKMTLRTGQLQRQRASFKRKLPDTCILYAVSNTIVSRYDPSDSQYPNGIPCRVTRLPLRTDFDDSGNPIYTRRFQVALPGDLRVPSTAALIIVTTQDNITLQSLVPINTNESEQISISVDMQQVPTVIPE